MDSLKQAELLDLELAMACGSADHLGNEQELDIFPRLCAFGPSVSSPADAAAAAAAAAAAGPGARLPQWRRTLCIVLDVAGIVGAVVTVVVAAITWGRC